MVERIRRELGADARVVATGGLAHLVGSESSAIERVEPFLTLEGLRIIFEKNRPQAEKSQKERSS
jgi:type III pantothenate kinase